MIIYMHDSFTGCLPIALYLVLKRAVYGCLVVIIMRTISYLAVSDVDANQLSFHSSAFDYILSFNEYERY